LETPEKALWNIFPRATAEGQVYCLMGLNYLHSTNYPTAKAALLEKAKLLIVRHEGGFRTNQSIGNLIKELDDFPMAGTEWIVRRLRRLPPEPYPLRLEYFIQETSSPTNAGNWLPARDGKEWEIVQGTELFSQFGVVGAGAVSVEANEVMGKILKRSDAERILANTFVRANVEGKTYCLAGLGYLKSPSYPRLHDEMLKQPNLKILRREGCLFSTPTVFEVDKEWATRDESLLRDVKRW
jgi:hypothetical protein